MTTRRLPPCQMCKHRHEDDTTCEAFPEGIPKSYDTGELFHSKKEGDQFFYEPADRSCPTYEDCEQIYQGEAPFEDDQGDDSDTNWLDGGPDMMAKTYGELDTSAQDDHVEFVSSLYQKDWVRTHTQALIDALASTFHMGKFVKVSPERVGAVYADLISIMTLPEGWSLRQVMDRLEGEFPNMSDYEAERIARTESHKIANKARELQFQEEDPDELYEWLGANDHRTTEICKEIKERSKGGMKLEDLRNLVIEVQTAHKMKYVGDWSPHPNCRHKLVPHLD